MITCTTQTGAAIVEFEISGTVTDADYRDVLIPALEASLAEHERVRALVVISPAFERYTFGAAVDDAEYGLYHWDGFDRVAVAGRPGALVSAIEAFALFMPCPVRVFPLEKVEDARLWLRESLGTIHQTDLGGGVVQVALMGRLDAEMFTREGAALDAYLGTHDGLKLLLDLRSFEGWQSLSALGRHWRLAQGHRPAVEKVAVVGHARWQKLVARAARHVFGLDAKVFDDAALDDAVAWLRG